MPDKTYEDGLVEGRVMSLERMMVEHKGRLDNHSKRLSYLERAMWMLAGIVLFINAWPAIRQVMMGG